MNEQDFNALWKALADPTRRELLDLLHNGRKSTGELCDAFGDLTRYAVMKHLGVLVDANLVLVRREGRMRWNYLNAVPLQALHERWVAQFAASSASGLLGLRQVAERSTEGTAMSRSTHIEQEITINAPREKVYEALTQNVDEWWAFRLAGESTTVSVDARPGGQILEQRPDGGGEYWGTIQAMRSPDLLRIEGPLGTTTPMIGIHKYVLEDADGKTILKLTHEAFGVLSDEWEKLYGEGWTFLLEVCLKSYVEEGKHFSEHPMPTPH